jgi:hypothetical protein
LKATNEDSHSEQIRRPPQRTAAIRARGYFHAGWSGGSPAAFLCPPAGNQSETFYGVRLNAGKTMKRRTAPTDINLRILAATTLAASGRSSIYDMAQGNPGAWPDTFPADGGGWTMKVILAVTSMKISAGNETYSFVVQTSPDGVNWTNASRTVNLGTGTVTDTITPPDSITLDFASRSQFVQLVYTLAGTSPSMIVGDCFVCPYTNSRK